MVASKHLGTVEEDEDEHHALIELAGGRRRNPRPAAAAATERSRPRVPGGSGPSGRRWGWVAVLFLVGLGGVYHLGRKEGQSAERGARNGPAEGHAKTATAAAKQAAKAPAKAAGTFTRDTLAAVRGEGRKLTALLEDYYGGKEQAEAMLLHSWVGAWDFEGAPPAEAEAEAAAAERRRADKVTDTVARALVTDDQDAFLIGGIGSSVMAGHDNCHYDSYGSQLERTLGPAWAAAGMRVEFQNAGEGGGCGDSHKNQHFCAKQNVSPDVDVLHYSWTYFEGGKAGPQHEELARWIQMLPKQPPLHIYNTGDKKRSGQDDVLVEHYADYALNAFYQETGFRNGGHDYAAEKANGTDRFGRGFVGDGYHDVVRYGEELPDGDPRKESLGVVMRNWHPGPMGFQLTADAFAYVYTLAMLRALDMIEADMNDGRDPRDTWSAETRLLLLGRDLPEPKLCDPEYCVVDEAPGCTNYEAPAFGFWGARVEDATDDLNPYGPEATGSWAPWKEQNDVLKMVGRSDTAIFQQREDKEMCRHLDACGGLSAKKAADGTVVFRLPKMEVGLVVLCGCCGKGIAQSMFLGNVKSGNIEISYNTVPVDMASMDIWPENKCVRINKRFPTSGREAETPTGHAYLAIKVLKDMSAPVRISHVITL